MKEYNIYFTIDGLAVIEANNPVEAWEKIRNLDPIEKNAIVDQAIQNGGFGFYDLEETTDFSNSF
ncbi:MAG: hypothetical protein ACRCU3_01930 [Eubacteriaceae bacterium]